MLYPSVLRVGFFLLLLSAPFLFSQDSLSVDVSPAMHVCSDKNPADASPCAKAPRVLKRVDPLYPEKALQERKEGTVTLGLTVTKDGSVTSAHVLKGVDKDIDQAAVEAVRQWKFDPGTYQDRPVDVEFTVTLNFRLSSSPQQGLPPNTGGQKEAAADFRNLYSDASEAYNRGDYATATNLLRALTSMNPQNGNAWNELGRALLAMNQLDAAAQALRTSIEKDPSSRNAYNNLGLAYWRQGKFQEAEAQFRKQMVVNPDDHYAHRNLGMMLRDQQRCQEAMPELQKALSLTPNHAESLLAQGECDLDLGNRAKGISELEQAASVSSSPGMFNSAAYVLAKRNIELGMAEKWSEISLNIEKMRFQSISLDHLTPAQLSYVYRMAIYWDTRGWIYFLQGDYSDARSYVEAAWSIYVNPSIGNHLGRIYEKLGRSDAAEVYAMAVASADQPTRVRIDLADLADAKKQLTKLAGDTTESMIKKARVELSGKSLIPLPNHDGLSASADFAVRLSSTEKPEFRQLNGDKALSKFTDALQASKLPVFIPATSGVQVTLRGTLTCHSDEPQCHFAFLSPEQAVEIARNEMAQASDILATSAPHDPHVYDDPAMGMRISLPNEWSLLKVEPGSFSRPRNAFFGKPGSTAMFMLTRERFEGPPDLYLKMLDKFFSAKTEFNRAGQMTVKRDGLAGTRWNVSWNENGIAYSAVTEIFGVGDDYYRITTLAPKEVYDRYSETFEDVLRSLQFPMLRVKSQLLDSAK